MKSQPDTTISPGMLAEKTLIQRYSPPCVVINDKFEVIYFSTRTNRYLEPPVGEPTQNLLKMAKDNLRPALRAAAHKALKEQQVATYKGLNFTTESGEETLDLIVEPITKPPSAKGLALVIFEPKGIERHAAPIAESHSSPKPSLQDEVSQDVIIQQLEEQLRITNEQLQTNIEQMETSNEELKSSNEELMSMNEEFQSTNEELETSKEELQALNEELVTVNAELQNKVDELSETNSDLQNFLASTDIATIFLDRQFKVKRFSPAMAKLFNLMPSDIGRPLQHFRGGVSYPELQVDAQEVLDTLAPMEREIVHPEQKLFYMVRILPYRTLEDVIDGVVVTFINITASKMMEAERQRERNLLQSIMQTTDVNLVYLDNEFNFVMVNQSYADTCRMSPEEMIGKNHFTLYPNAENEAIFKEVRDTGKSVFFKDKPFSFPDQPERGVTYWDWSLAPVLGDNEEMTGLVFSLRETTEYKMLENAFQETEDRFQLFMDHNPAIAWIKDEKGQYVYMNKTFEDQFNVTLVEGENITDYDIWSKDIADQILTNDSIVLREQRPFEVTETTPRTQSDGTNRTWWTLKFPVIDSTGQQYVGGLALDVSERYAAEKALQESENMVRTLLDSVDEGFLVIDREYRIIMANKPFYERVGRPKEEVIGEKCHSVLHKLGEPCHQRGSSCAAHSVFCSGQPQTFSHVETDENGEKKYIEVRAYPIVDEQGVVVSVVEAISDVTDKTILENERLKSQKLESIGTLAGGIAHDFNNLLQVLFGYISFAKNDYDQKKVVLRYLDRAEEALNQAVGLTNQLLTFSKGGAPKKYPLSILYTVEHAAKFVLSGSQVEYKLIIHERPWGLEADEAQLMQVFQNICFNAREAMGHKGILRITIDNLTKPPENVPELSPDVKYLRIRIQDSGIGIPEQNLTKIFDPYFSTKERGSGLGLSTALSVIHRHEGAIQVKSTENEGTTFTVFLPATETPLPEKKAVLPLATAVKKARILVMDDEKMIRKLLSKMLISIGHEADCAADGQEAIDKYSAALAADNPYDLVILDLTVKGGMGGEEAIKHLLQIDPDVRAIVSSGYAENNVVAHYQDYGLKAALNKPYRKEKLSQCIQQVLNSQS